MRHVTVGSLSISELGYGSWEIGGVGYGPNVSEEAAARPLRAAVDHGLDYIDTGEMYGRGFAEELIGRTLGNRDDVVVGSKVTPRPTGTGLRPQAIRRACVGSLQRLRREAIELYYLHWPDPTVPIEESWGAMADLVREGLVREIALSNFDRVSTQRCHAEWPVACVQNHFSMLHRQEVEYVEWCGGQGIPVVAYGVLGFGLLTGKLNEETKFADDDWRSGRSGSGRYYWPLFSPMAYRQSLSVGNALAAVAADTGASAAELAVAWTLAQPGISGAIIGSRKREHIESLATGSSDSTLSPTVLESLDQVCRLGPEYFG